MKVLITGISGHFGLRMEKILNEDPDITQVIGIGKEEVGSVGEDIFHHEKLSYYQADTTVRTIEEVFQRNKGIDAILHLSYNTNPYAKSEEAHNVNVFGTMRMLELARKYKVKKFIFPSSASVYGAHPDNPPLLKENDLLRGNRDFPYIRDRVEADQICQLFLGGDFPKVVILRPPGILRKGKGAKGPLDIYFGQKFVPMIFGFDPMFQVIFEDDLIHAFLLCLKKEVEGIYNIAGFIYDPLSAVIKKLGKISIPIPEKNIKTILNFMWKTKIIFRYPFDLNYFKYSFCVDMTKAKKELGYKPVVKI